MDVWHEWVVGEIVYVGWNINVGEVYQGVVKAVSPDGSQVTVKSLEYRHPVYDQVFLPNQISSSIEEFQLLVGKRGRRVPSFSSTFLSPTTTKSDECSDDTSDRPSKKSRKK